jgi:purine-binding chemotaxis protein CheW
MTDAHAGVASRAEQLRRAFDRTFAEPPRAAIDDAENLLAIGVGGDSYAVRLGEIAGVFVDRTIVPLPTPIVGLLGVAALRAGIVPVYALRALLGHSTTSETPRWLFLARDAVALAFDQFDGHVRIARSAIAPAVGESSRAHVRETARIGSAMRAVVSVESLVDAIKQRVGVVEAIKERRHVDVR